MTSNPAYMTQLWNNYLDISEVLLKVKRLEEMKTESSQRSQVIEQFTNWLTENGARADGVSIAEFPGYDLGLKAEADFAENQLILEIPRALIFSTYTAAPELTALQNDPLVQHMPQVALAIALLVERYKKNSTWKPYLDILPNSYNTVLYMKANDMIELKGSPTLGRDYFYKPCALFSLLHFIQIYFSYSFRIFSHFTFINLFYTIFRKVSV